MIRELAKGKGLNHMDFKVHVKQHVNKQGAVQQLCVMSLIYGVIAISKFFQGLFHEPVMVHDIS